MGTRARRTLHTFSLQSFVYCLPLVAWCSAVVRALSCGIVETIADAEPVARENPEDNSGDNSGNSSDDSSDDETDVSSFRCFSVSCVCSIWGLPSSVDVSTKHDSAPGSTLGPCASRIVRPCHLFVGLLFDAVLCRRRRTRARRRFPT